VLDEVIGYSAFADARAAMLSPEEAALLAVLSEAVDAGVVAKEHVDANAVAHLDIK
jgi:hypothetical protein